MASAEPTWDPQVQMREMNDWRRHQESGLTVSGAGLALVSAILVFEVLSVNEDTNTFLVLGALNLAIILSWIVVARRAARRLTIWMLRAKRIEVELLRVPENEAVTSASERGLPAWVAVGAALVGFAVLWAGLMIYASWYTYLRP